jgi:uncharacterized protein (TIGR03435 family)
VVEAAFWFHPLVWWMERRMVEEREHACDEAVVAMGSSPGVYAESLLKACRFCVESPLVCVAGITGADLASRVRSIMTLRLERLSLWRKVALASLAIAAIAGPVAFGVVRMIPMYGQMLHATGPLPAFDVMAIKPSKEPPQGGTTTGEQVHLIVTAKLLIQLAYNVPMMSDEQVSGGPDWINTEVFDILAKMDSAKFTSMQNMSRAQRREQQQLMEESLLADRMKLKVHFETRDMPVYALTSTKGFKLKPVTVAPVGATMLADGVRPEDLRRGVVVSAKGKGFEMTAKGVTLAEFVRVLIPRPELSGRTVVDQTGLTEAYDFTLDWGPEQTAAPENGEVEEPSLFEAIQQQLGLKLAAAKGPGEVIVIDHIEKPVFENAEVVKPEARVMLAAEAQDKAPGRYVGANQPAFEVASIRMVNSHAAEELQRGAGSLSMSTYPSTRFFMHNTTLDFLIGQAFGIDLQYIQRDRGWMDSQLYDIDARVNGERPLSEKEIRPLLQNLLEQRFHFAAHRTSKLVSGFFLVAAKGGPQLKPARDGAQTSAQIQPNRLVAQSVSTTLLSSILMRPAGQPVVDKTGLTGSYDITLSYASANDTNSTLPSLFTAIQEQLGLKLEPAKVPVGYLVIDHADRVPTEN